MEVRTDPLNIPFVCDFCYFLKSLLRPKPRNLNLGLFEKLHLGGVKIMFSIFNSKFGFGKNRFRSPIALLDFFPLMKDKCKIIDWPTAAFIWLAFLAEMALPSGKLNNTFFVWALTCSWSKNNKN